MRNEKPDWNHPPLHLAETTALENPVEARKQLLKQLSDRLDTYHDFRKGQFVRWKPGLKNRKFPEYGEPVIVTGILPNPIHDPGEGSAASPYFHEPLNLIIGSMPEEGLLEYRVDARRFEPADD